MNHSTKNKWKASHGFTFVELMISAALSMLVLASVFMLALATTRSWRTISLRMQASQDANLAINRIIYGDAGRKGVRCASTATYTANGNGGWIVTYKTGSITSVSNAIIYSATDQTITANPGAVVVGRGVDFAWAAADSQIFAITVSVNRVAGSLSAQAEAGTEVRFRNRP